MNSSALITKPTLAIFGIALAIAGIAACSTSDQAKLAPIKARLVVDGQLFCAKYTTAGPVVVALATSLGTPIVVTGVANTVVEADCALIDAFPVTPPPNPALAPVVTAPPAKS